MLESSPVATQIPKRFSGYQLKRVKVPFVRHKLEKWFPSAYIPVRMREGGCKGCKGTMWIVISLIRAEGKMLGEQQIRPCSEIRTL